MKISLETWNGTFEVELPEGATINDIIEKSGVTEAGLAVINGRAVPKDFVLNDGDVVKLHPPILGG